MRLFNHGFTDDSTILQHIFQIDQAAIVHMLCKIICIMEVDDSFFMRFCNVMRKQETCSDVFADFSCHIVSLYTVDYWIFIGVFLLDFFIFKIQQA